MHQRNKNSLSLTLSNNLLINKTELNNLILTIASVVYEVQEQLAMIIKNCYYSLNTLVMNVNLLVALLKHFYDVLYDV